MLNIGRESLGYIAVDRLNTPDSSLVRLPTTGASPFVPSRASGGTSTNTAAPPLSAPAEAKTLPSWVVGGAVAAALLAGLWFFDA